MRIIKLFMVLFAVVSSAFLSAFFMLADETEWLDDLSGYEDLLEESSVNIDDIGVDSLLSLAEDTAKTLLSDLLKKLPVLFSLACLMWIMKTISPRKNGRELCAAVETYASLYVFCTVLPEITDCAKSLIAVKDELGGVLTGAVGVVCFCAEADGFTGSSAVVSGWFSTELGLFVFVAEKVLMPVITLFVCLGLAAALTDAKQIHRASSAVRNGIVFLLSVSSSVLLSGLFFSVRETSGSDGILKKTAATALGKSIPIVGTVLGNNLDTVSLYLGSIIGKAGLYAVGVTAYYLLPVFLSVIAKLLLVFVVRIVFSVCGLEKGERMLCVCRDAAVFMLAVLLAYAALTVIGFGIVTELCV